MPKVILIPSSVQNGSKGTKGNHYERLSLRASLVLPHHTTQSIYTYAVALFETHGENFREMDGVKCVLCKAAGDQLIPSSVQNVRNKSDME